MFYCTNAIETGQSKKPLLWVHEKPSSTTVAVYRGRWQPPVLMTSSIGEQSFPSLKEAANAIDAAFSGTTGWDCYDEELKFLGEKPTLT